MLKAVFAASTFTLASLLSLLAPSQVNVEPKTQPISVVPVAPITAPSLPPASTSSPLRAVEKKYTCPTPVKHVIHESPLKKGRKTVALTFDDGPSDNTDKVLEILTRNHIHATFFTVGVNVVRRPSALKHIEAQGSYVANHSWDHPIPHSGGAFDKLSLRKQASEIDSTTNAIVKITGHKPCFFRAPGGHDTNPKTLALVRSRNMSLINWNYDPRDWAAPHKNSPSYQRHIVKYATGTSHGAVVLFHDGPPGLYRGNTVASLQRVINYYKSHGYVFTDPLGNPFPTS